MRHSLSILAVAALAFIVLPAAAQQVCVSESIPASTPTSDFLIHGDGTVTHKRTGLTWMRCPLGQKWDGRTCAGEADMYVWQKALQAAAAFNASGGYAGHKDWRVPNIKELDSIVENQCYMPSINLKVFPGALAMRHWSSTMDHRHPRSYALFVGFENGYGDDGRVSFQYPVRLVRQGQPSAAFDRKR